MHGSIGHLKLARAIYFFLLTTLLRARVATRDDQPKRIYMQRNTAMVKKNLEVLLLASTVVAKPNGTDQQMDTKLTLS